MRVKEKCQPYVTYMEISDSNSEFIVVLAVRTPSRPYFRVLDKSTCIPEIAVDFQYVWLIRYAICLLFSPVTQSWWQQTGILETLVAGQILALMPALGILELCALLQWLCERLGVPGCQCPMDRHPGEGCSWFRHYSASKHNTTVKIQLNTILKEGNTKKLASLKLTFCFLWACHRSTLTKLQLLCIVLLLSQLENTFFWGAIIQHKSQICNSFGLINSFQIRNISFKF